MKFKINPKWTSFRNWTNDSSNIEDQEDGNLLEKYHDSPSSLPVKETRLCSYSWIFVTTFNIFILCLTIISHFFGQRPITDQEAMQKTRAYSPVFDTFHPKLQTTTFNGSLFNYPSQIYRTDPTKEMDDEWSRISDSGMILITRDDVLSLGKAPETRSRASPALLSKMGFDPAAEMYHGTVDAFHQIHCLNTIRKHAYWDSYYKAPYGSWDDHNAHELHWTHISHCFSALLQNLKCNADLGIITHAWMDGQEAPFPDFNLEKKCVDFESLVEWNKDHGAPEDLEVESIQRPPPEEIETLYPAPAELYMLKGVEFPEGYVFDHEVVKPKHWFSSW